MFRHEIVNVPLEISHVLCYSQHPFVPYSELHKFSLDSYALFL